MKILNKFDEFIFENISNTLPFRLSDRLIDLLKKIEHPISKELLRLEVQRDSNKYTLIDYVDNNLGNFKYILSNKVYDVFKNKTLLSGNEPLSQSDIEKYFRLSDVSYLTNNFDNISVTSTIGKVINKLFPNIYPPSGKPGEDIESFTNLVKSKRDSKFEKFKIVSGDDIEKYYKYDSYDSNSPGSSIGNSCMRYGQCTSFINFYSINKGVKLVILFSDDEEDKIIGRALLWDIDEIDNSKVENTKFMDRIYTIYDSDVLVFKEYAEKNGWLYKNRQDMSSETKICNPKTNEISKLRLKTTSNFIPSKYDQYPYMDTMKWFFVNDGFLSNMDDTGGQLSKYYFMESTSGDYDERIYGGIYVEYYGRSFNENELIWCDFGEEYRTPHDAVRIDNHNYATQDYIDDYMIWSDFENKYIEESDSVYLDRYDTNVSNEYIEYHMTYCERIDEYLLDDDTVYSYYYESNIDKYDSVNVYTNINKTKHDYREEGDYTYITVKGEDGTEYYDKNEDLMKNFIEVIIEINPLRKIWDFKSNKNKYVLVKGKYYDKKFEDELTGQLRLDL